MPLELTNPGRTGEVSEVMRAASAAGIPVTAIDRQSGTAGGTSPDDGGIAWDRMPAAAREVVEAHE